MLKLKLSTKLNKSHFIDPEIIKYSYKFTKLDAIPKTLSEEYRLLSHNDVCDTPVSNYSLLYFYYLNILDMLPKNEKVCIIYITQDAKLSFELKDVLTMHNKCEVKSVFLSTKHVNSKDIIDPDNYEKIDTYVKNADTIILNNMLMHPIQTCQSESFSFGLSLLLINKILKNLKPNGNLYIYLQKMYIYQAYVDLFYYTSTLFNTNRIILNNITTLDIGYIKFANYNVNVGTNLDKLMANDKYTGKNASIIAYNLSYCDDADNNVKYVISSILDCPCGLESNLNFTQTLLDIYKQKNIMIQNNLKKAKYIKTLIDSKKSINTIIYNNLNESIELCKKYNVQINDIYKDYKIPDFTYFVNTYFPSGADLIKIQLTLDSTFSITTPSNTKRISILIKKHFENITHIIDGTSNIGTTPIVLSFYFKHIDAVELSEDTFAKLKNNVALYKAKNITLHLSDIIKFMQVHKFDIENTCLFLDPPWSGVFYKIHAKQDLYLSDVNVLDFLKYVNVKYICMKVPFNYNFAKMYKYFYNAVIYRLSGFYLILIKK